MHETLMSDLYQAFDDIECRLLNLTFDCAIQSISR